MNVFILDRDMERSAQMLDDAHLLAQINEGTQILMANYNRRRYPFTKIGHVNHPVTVFYSGSEEIIELWGYLRFGKMHQNALWVEGYMATMGPFDTSITEFERAKTLVGDNMTGDIDEIRRHIMPKPLCWCWPGCCTNRGASAPSVSTNCSPAHTSSPGGRTSPHCTRSSPIGLTSTVSTIERESDSLWN